MERSQMVVANLRYQSSKGGKGFGKVRDMARYFQYRQDRDRHIPQERGLERWVDQGLGGNFRQIAERCEAFKSPHVQAFFLVINPNPDLMALVPPEAHEGFVKALTERSLEAFFAARGLDVPEYSYAYHLRATLDAGKRDNPHTHVILPGSYASWADGVRLPLYMNRNARENHIELLHQVVEAEAERLLEHHIGLDWEQRYDALHPPIPATPPIDPLVIDPLVGVLDVSPPPQDTPHGQMRDAEGQPWQVWVVTRQDLFTDGSYQVGFLLAGSASDEPPRFVPQVADLHPYEAEALADYMVAALATEGVEVADVVQFAAHIGAMTEQERSALFAGQAPTLPQDWGLDLDR